MARCSAADTVPTSSPKSSDSKTNEYALALVSVVEPAGTNTNIDANAPEADAKLDEYREARAVVAQSLTALITNGDHPSVVAEVVLKAASAARPKLRYTAGSTAWRLRLIRDFAPAGIVDAAIRKQMRLNTLKEE